MKKNEKKNEFDKERENKKEKTDGPTEIQIDDQR